MSGNSGILFMKFHEIYDQIFAEKPYKKEVSLAMALLGGQPSKVLEIGCGTGRHTEALLRRGLKVTAVDTDPAMILLAKERNRFYLGKRLRLALGGVDKAPRKPVDGALSLFHVVNYLQTEKDLLRFFSEISLRLKTGKRLVFDAWNGLAAILDPPRTTTPARTICREQERIVFRTKTTTDLWKMRADLEVAIRSQGGKPETYRYTHRIWLPAELCGFLEMSRMKCERICTWKNSRRQATPRDWKIVFVARKM